MDRGEELMQLNRVAFDRNTQAFEQVMAALDRNEQMFEENKQLIEENRLFIREMNRRNERVVQSLVQGNQKFLADLSVQLQEGRDEAREGREEARAQTQALLTLIDRLPPPAQAA
jgi:hypothetical protein